MMYKAIINDGRTLSLTPLSDGGFDVDAKQISPDVVEIKEGVFHIILDNKSYNAEVIKTDSAEKTFHIKVNNHIYKICLQTRYDELLKELGMDSSRSKKVSEMKAPMPGMVVEVAVEEGQEVKKGDRILVLEAMKMENILKCPADGIVKKVKVIKGNTVEKNEVLVTFV